MYGIFTYIYHKEINHPCRQIYRSSHGSCKDSSLFRILRSATAMSCQDPKKNYEKRNITPQKSNMEPQNHFELKRKLIFQTYILGFHVSFRGSTPQKSNIDTYRYQTLTFLKGVTFSPRPIILGLILCAHRCA